ncbi:uncharacterized protein LOC122002003 isoform X1 [Zingiber officinale]|uniref:Bifunctional lysine-specific demethylase and histidyl-hydroxylase n=2 Tax=Zingiber officinale TaxID=94328 RepID=A0A8J5FUZ0_ZINOF|nr:uncharacterized protein LOC122002003 isoform X1 [Zingiber officinale]KAG6493380.1 hypothetical protein ZIOFF_048363 [Zingiber officinale]
MDETRSGHKRRRDSSSPPLDVASFDRNVFPLLLAAASSRTSPNQHSRSVLRRFLRSRLALISTRPSSCTTPKSLLPNGLIALLPLLLTSRWPSVVRLSADVVRSAALYSIEMNEVLALNGEIAKGLVLALGNGRRQVAKTVCNAILDLSISQAGREQLCKALSVERLLSLFYQEVQVNRVLAVHQGMRKEAVECSKGRPMNESFVALILAAAVTLINSSTEDFLDRIPSELVKRCLPLLQEIWKKSRCPLLHGNGQRCWHIMKNGLPTTIFKLSMNQNLATWNYDKIRVTMFGDAGSEFVTFVSKYWEKSPVLLSEVIKNLEKENGVFRCLINSFNHQSTNDILDSVLMKLVSCQPLASDELDINCFLNENSSLGSPLIYGLDIRVVKAQQVPSESFKKKEVHFFDSSSGILFSEGDYATKCKKAFQDGFTIALRGMEFRFAEIASITRGLADLFGQPSVGANLYITPPGSQGLTFHYDDHCVFVWQLFGQKYWFVSSSPTSILPRLYEPISSLPSIENEKEGGLQMFLNEGDILYIPRGCPHEAHTKNDAYKPQQELCSGLSLHLTLSMEVEPPFAWEGFAHVALHCWHEMQKEASDCIPSMEARRRKVFSVFLLHVAIKLIADDVSIFRKACLIAAKFVEHHADTLRLNQKANFLKIINIIDVSSNFTETFEKTVVQEANDNFLEWMRWLRHLPQRGVEDVKIDFDDPSRMRSELIELSIKGNEEMKDEFFQTKSRFCRSLVYEEACRMFQVMLEKYRRTRNQYMNGMLALHT